MGEHAGREPLDVVGKRVVAAVGPPPFDVIVGGWFAVPTVTVTLCVPFAPRSIVSLSLARLKIVAPVTVT